MIKGKSFKLPRKVLILLIFSFLFNIYGIWWGLPSSTGWATDEITPKLVENAIEKKFSNGWYSKYPPFHYYILSASYIPVYVLDSFKIIDINSLTLYFIMFLLGRLVSVIMGVLIVLLTYLCGLEIYNKSSSFFAALIVSLTAPFFYYSKVVNLDIPYVFWFMVSLLFFIRIIKKHNTYDYLFFTISTVFSICTKDQAYGLYVLAPIPIVISHYLLNKSKPKYKFSNSIFNYKIFISISVAIVIFAISFNLFFNFDGFLNHFKLITGTASEPFKIFTNDLSGHLNMFLHSIGQVAFSLGWPFFLICFAGIIWSLFKIRENSILLVLLTFIISYYIFFISIIQYNYVRFFLSTCIILAFFGGKLISDFISLSKLSEETKYFLIGVVFIYSFFYTSSIGVFMTFDSRYEVESWMEKNIDKNSLVGYVGLEVYLPRMTTYNTKKIRPKGNSLIRKKPDYLIINADLKFKKNGVFYNKLIEEKFRYFLVYNHKKYFNWTLINQKKISNRTLNGVYSNIDKINPEILIFKKKKIL